MALRDRWKECEHLLVKVLESSRKALVAQHGVRTRAMMDLYGLFQKQNRHSEAVDLLLQLPFDAVKMISGQMKVPDTLAGFAVLATRKTISETWTNRSQDVLDIVGETLQPIWTNLPHTISSSGPPAIELCYMSNPLSSSPEMVVFVIEGVHVDSRDDPSSESSTWFAASITRPRVGGVTPVQPPVSTDHRPVDFTEYLRGQNRELVAIPTVKASTTPDEEPSRVLITLSRNLISPLCRTHHTICWTDEWQPINASDRTGDGSEYVKTLKAGDCIMVFAGAQVCLRYSSLTSLLMLV